MDVKKVIRALALPLAVCLLVGCAAAGGGTAAPGKALKVGVRSSIVNFGYQDPESGRFYGLGVDIGEELAKRLGRRAEFVAVSSADREEKLSSGTVDCLVAAYTITPERQEKFDFSAPYYHDTIKVMVENSTGFTSVKDLGGATVGVLKNTNAESELATELRTLHAGTVTMTTFPSYDELVAALECGDVDAACMDGSIAQGYLNDARRFLEEEFGSEEFGVATVKGSDLSGEIAAAVQAMLDDGTIAALCDKWD